MSYEVKLVRDGVGEVVGDGHTVSYERIGSRSDHARRLREKLLEEVAEYLTAEHPDAKERELADIIEVCRALAVIDIGTHPDGDVALGILLDLVASRRTERGSFLAGTVMVASFDALNPAEQAGGKDQ